MNQRQALETVEPFTVKNTPLRPREREQLLERPGSFHVESDNGELILAHDMGQQRLWWGFRSVEDMRHEFPPMWERVLAQIDREHIDYVAMDLSGLPTRTWLDPILKDADFEFFAEWMDMAHPDIADLPVPEFPDGVRMRKATDEDLGRFYEIWSQAYGDYGDGPATFDWLVDEAAWSGALEDDSGTVVAFAMNGHVEGAEGRILAAAVDPDAWGNGYGALVLSAATYALAASDAMRATIRVRPDITQGLRICASQGFRHARAGLEFRRDKDEAAIEDKRYERRVAGVKARFGGWR